MELHLIQDITHPKILEYELKMPHKAPQNTKIRVKKATVFTPKYKTQTHLKKEKKPTNLPQRDE